MTRPRSPATVFVVALALAACGGDSVAVEVSSTDTQPATSATTNAPTTTTTAPSTTSAPPTTATTSTSTTTTTTTTTAAPTTTTTTTTTAAPTTTTTTTTTAAPTTTTTSIDYVGWGAELATNLGCLVCHSTDGSAGLGPTWAGLGGSTVTLADGSTVSASAAYLQESIVNPDAKIVEGFSAGLMQNDYAGLSADELTALVAYIGSR